MAGNVVQDVLVARGQAVQTDDRVAVGNDELFVFRRALAGIHLADHVVVGVVDLQILDVLVLGDVHRDFVDSGFLVDQAGDEAVAVNFVAEEGWRLNAHLLARYVRKDQFQHCKAAPVLLPANGLKLEVFR